jgi:hypothetical protein
VLPISPSMIERVLRKSRPPIREMA